MTYQDLWRTHPGKVCICRPFLRDIKTKRVLAWYCLETAITIEAARATLERLALDGVTDAVPISTSEKMSIDHFPETYAMVEGASRMEDSGSFLDASG